MADVCPAPSDMTRASPDAHIVKQKGLQPPASSGAINLISGDVANAR